ncbi:MAG: helix-turn-helix domain-containing protein [Anaerolineales bacterium]|nr:helix-turn-helix domain-containing protein [Anaerolineales bacterium]
MMNEQYVGSDFDSFLEEESILQETERVAVKRVLAMHLQQLMQEQRISKVEMARRMETSRSALNRLLDPKNESVTLHTMERAAHVLGKHLHLTLA